MELTTEGMDCGEVIQLNKFRRQKSWSEILELRSSQFVLALMVSVWQIIRHGYRLTLEMVLFRGRSQLGFTKLAGTQGGGLLLPWIPKGTMAGRFLRDMFWLQSKRRLKYCLLAFKIRAQSCVCTEYWQVVCGSLYSMNRMKKEVRPSFDERT